jgi:hypothetical protein
MAITAAGRPTCRCWRWSSDGQSEALAGPVAELARVPLVLTLSDARCPIGRDEVAELRAGMLAPSTRERRD